MLASLVEFQNTLGDSFSSVTTVASEYLPSIVIAIILVLVGWAIGSLVAKLIEHFFKTLHFIDDALRSVKIGEVLQRAGLNLNTGKFIGILVQIFIILVALVAAFDIVGLSEINRYLSDQILGYIPNVIVAALILVAGAVIAEFVKNFVRGATKATRIQSANMAGAVAKWAVLIFTVLAALHELQVAERIIEAVIVSIIAAISLAVGLAFGLGGQRAAAECLDKMSDEIRR